MLGHKINASGGAPQQAGEADDNSLQIKKKEANITKNGQKKIFEFENENNFDGIRNHLQNAIK